MVRCIAKAKLPKTFYKNTEKKLKRKKQQRRRKINRGEKSKYISLLGCKKKFCHWAKFSDVATGALLPYFGLLKTLFLEHHVTTTDNDAKRNNNIQSYLLD